MELTIDTVDTPTYELFRGKIKFAVISWKDQSVLSRRDCEDLVVQALLVHVQLDPLFAASDAPGSMVLNKKILLVRQHLTTPIQKNFDPLSSVIKSVESKVTATRPIATYMGILAKSLNSHRKFNHNCFALYCVAIEMVNPKPLCP